MALPAGHPAANSAARHFAMREAAAAQHPALAVPQLLSLVLRSPMRMLPAATSVPLPASCAVTLETVHLSMIQSREQLPRAGSDHKRVSLVCSVLSLPPRRSHVGVLSAASGGIKPAVHRRPCTRLPCRMSLLHAR